MPEKQSDFLTQYKALKGKLKKKFLKKTNAAESSNLLASCAAQSERSDLPQFAALAWCAVANNEFNLCNRSEEANAFLKAGRLFLDAERRNIIGCDENIKSGIWCLHKVRELWGEEKPVTGGLCLEAGSALVTLSAHDGRSFLEAASTLLTHSPQLRLSALGWLASARLSLGDYHGAVSLFSEMVDMVHQITSTPCGVYKDILIRCEICRVLLILLLQPTPQKISPQLAKIVDKYTWIGEPDPKTFSWLGEELFFLLQSLVMACQCNDLIAVHDLESDLWKYFNNEQRVMLHSIIQMLNNSDK